MSADADGAGDGEVREWRVPVIDPDTGDGHDEIVEAGSAREAMQQIPPRYHVSSTFVRDHLGIEHDPEAYD